VAFSSAVVRIAWRGAYSDLSLPLRNKSPFLESSATQVNRFGVSSAALGYTATANSPSKKKSLLARFIPFGADLKIA
jgi:hypothetical protein